MGFRVKSGVLMPSGSSSTYWVIITPGTFDFFFIFTVDSWDALRYLEMYKCSTALISIHMFQKRLYYTFSFPHIIYYSSVMCSWNLQCSNSLLTLPWSLWLLFLCFTYFKHLDLDNGFSSTAKNPHYNALLKQFIINKATLLSLLRHSFKGFSLWWFLCLNKGLFPVVNAQHILES